MPGGRFVGVAQSSVPIAGVPIPGYQAWVLPQCGQPTEVETEASKTSPQRQL